MSNGAKMLELAARHVGEKYVFGARVPMSNHLWKGPWDCAEFASWCYYQISGQLFGCDQKKNPATADAYTGYWKRDALATKCITSVATARSTPGALLLRFPAPALIGHIAISDGNGGTVEAHSTKLGVIRSKVDGRRWDIGVLPPGITYNVPQTISPYTTSGLVLRLKTPAMSGAIVTRLQERLADLGYSPGPVDGKYGHLTAAAVLSFQLANGLAPDGEVGPRTSEALGLTLPH